MNPALANNRAAVPLSFAPAQAGAHAPPSGLGTPVPNSNLAAQQQQQLLMQKAQENQNQLQLEKSRVSLLLEINTELLKESLNLQATKAAAGTTTDITEDLKALEKSYNECLQRLKVNLAYLAAMADRRTSTLPAAPALLVPPSNTPSLNEPYKRLQALFPGINNGMTTSIPNLQPGHARGNSQTVMATSTVKALPNQQPQLSHSSPPPQPQPQQLNANQHPLSQPQTHPQQSPMQPGAMPQNQNPAVPPSMMQNVMNPMHGAMQNMGPIPQMSQMSPHQQQQLHQLQQIQQQQAINRQQQQNTQLAMHQQQSGQMNMNAMSFNPGFYLQQAQMQAQAQMMRPQQNPRMMGVTNAAGMGSTGMMAPTMAPTMSGMDPMFGTGEMNWNFGMPGNWSMGGTG